MMRGSYVGEIAILFLLSFFLSAGFVVADWHGGKVLVMYKKGSDGWVQHNYNDSSAWGKFRNEFAEQGWNVAFAKHVNAAKLSEYDALFVLTPTKNIPDDEAEAIINWVKSGGQLVIGQSDGRIEPYANEITEIFGIKFEKSAKMRMKNFTVHALTTTPNYLKEVKGASKARSMNISGSSIPLGFDAKGRCLLAINESAGDGVIVAIGDEWLWSNSKFGKADNEELLDNILVYFTRTCSVPEFSTLTFLIPVFLLAVLFLFRRKG